MAGRIRSVKPDWLDDEKLGSASDEARVLSIGLLLLADDYGNGRARPNYLANQVWMYAEESRESVAKASRTFRELLALGFVTLYEVRGEHFFHITNWERHQRVDKPGRPRVPGPEKVEDPKHSRKPRGDISAHSRKPREGPGPDRELELEGERELARAREAPPAEVVELDAFEQVERLRRVVLRSFGAKYLAATGTAWLPAKHHDSIGNVAAWAIDQARTSNATPEEILESTFEGFFADTRARDAEFKFGWIATDPAEYFRKRNGMQSGLRVVPTAEQTDPLERAERLVASGKAAWRKTPDGDSQAVLRETGEVIYTHPRWTA